jgi:predicted nucleic acid-binding protein
MKITKKVFIDTAPIIYHTEGKAEYLKYTQFLFDAIDDGQIYLVSSRVVLSELLVLPLREQNPTLVEKYMELVSPIIPYESSIFDDAKDIANLRSVNHFLKYPDAENIMVAVRERCDFFITNDKQLQKIVGLGTLKVLMLPDVIDELLDTIVNYQIKP